MCWKLIILLKILKISFDLDVLTIYHFSKFWHLNLRIQQASRVANNVDDIFVKILYNYFLHLYVRIQMDDF